MSPVAPEQDPAIAPAGLPVGSACPVGRAPGPVDRRAVAVLGFSAGLLAALGPDAVLLPLVAETAPRAMGLSALVLLLAVGWAWADRRPTPGRRLLIGLGAATLAGGLAMVQLLPWSRELLQSLLIDDQPWPGTLLISLSCSLALAPLALPLGGLLGLAVTADDRRSLALFCLGASLGLGSAPHLGEIWLGRAGALQVATLCAVAAASALAEAPRLPAARRLPRGALAGMAYVSMLSAVCLYLAPPVIDLGPHGSTWFIAVLTLGASLGLTLPPARAPALLDGLTLLGLAPLLGLTQSVSLLGATGIAADVLTLIVVALPLGLFAGRALALGGSGAGAPGWAAAVMAVFPATALYVFGLPQLGAAAMLVAGGLTLALACLALNGRPAPGRLLLCLAGAAALAAVPLPSAVEGLHPDALQDSRHGVLARVTDPADGSPRLAIDGRAALGRSALARRRLVHLPFLLRGHARRALLVASDLGQAVEAARLHEPDALDWLRPVPAPWQAAPVGGGEQRGPVPREAHGNERLHLARQQGGYDLIVHLPDPRGQSRARLTGTREFFAECATALRPQGLFCQWWDLAAIDITDLKGVIGGALGAFEYTYLIIDHPRSRHAVIGIMGSHSEVHLRPSAIDAALAERPAVAADWDAVGLDGLLTCCLLIQHGGVLKLRTPVERSVGDERATLGVRGGLRDMPQPATTRLAMETFSNRRCNPMHWISVPGDERTDTRLHVRDVQRGWQHLLGGAQEVVGTLGGDSPPFDTEAAGQGPEIEAEGFVQALASLSDWDYLEQLVLDMATRREHEGQAGSAEQYLRRAVSEAPTLPSLRFALAGVVERGGDRDDACELYGTVLAFDPDHAGALAAMARLCDDD